MKRRLYDACRKQGRTEYLPSRLHPFVSVTTGEFILENNNTSHNQSVLRTAGRRVEENMWRASLRWCWGRTTGLCMQTARGTEMSQWLTLGPCRLKIDRDELTQYCGFTIKGTSNSGISVADCTMTVPFPLCPHCPSLKMSLLKLSVTHCLFHFSKMKYSKTQ